ncbi:hypothetical protein [Vibrio methylphosphonaticus]|uniref:hypothetical protein n=1 Tax=Vibrio methylphosphonaticus TaxID=2946866 RepID=UPI002029C0B0|nr:hypothetical protein [Vibrio methylphosphonaticus]MCL9777547.1 hypothetical protein [Vibrio methylphosphonaticus]
MVNLTPEQMTLLTWMKDGNKFNRCSDYGPQNGAIRERRKMPIKLHLKTLDKLLQHGLIQYKSYHTFGLRWDEFRITSKGRLAVC